MSVRALIPVKSFARAKSRMTQLPADRRVALARSLFEHVLAVLEQCSALSGITVITNGDDVEALARQRGAEVLRDSALIGTERISLGSIIDAAIAELAARGQAEVLVLMSDLPCLRVQQVEGLISGLKANGNQVVIAPDRHELGTNALGLTAPGAMQTAFGSEDSFLRHLDYFRVHGLRYQVQREPELGLDLDWPADLERVHTLQSQSPRQ